MLHIGCHLSVSKGYKNMAKDAVSIGADTFAFFTRNPRGGQSKPIDEKDIKAFLEESQKNNFVKLVAHAPYTMNPCSKDEKTRDFALRAMKEDLVKMEYTPNNYYNFHPGSHVGQGVKIGIELISDMLNKTLTKEQTTIVLLETMAGKGSEVGSKFEELKAIIDKVELKEKIGVCMDSCHLSDAGYDIIGDLDGVVKEFDEIIGIDYLKAMHINDSMNDFASHKDRHAPIGEGTLGLKTFENLVNHPKLKDLPFILETPHSKLEEYAKEITLLRSLTR